METIGEIVVMQTRPESWKLEMRSDAADNMSDFAGTEVAGGGTIGRSEGRRCSDSSCAVRCSGRPSGRRN